MARLWARLLKVDESTIQASSDFFDLGGHSLLLAKLSAALQKDMGAAVSIPAIIERPTLAELAELLDKEMTATTADTPQGEALGKSGGGPVSVVLPTPALRYVQRQSLLCNIVVGGLWCIVWKEDGGPSDRLEVR